ncbi:MAG: Serine aminopeptidase [Firmicutes bacterium]|nr:Serine aminopeptidase [Bacillota bacterium]
MSETLIIRGPDSDLAAVIHRPKTVDLNCSLIFCHGFRGSKEGGGRATLLAEQAAKLGYIAVRFDFTPLGCLSKQVAELKAAAHFCRYHLAKRIVLFGRSMGGSAALAYAAGCDDINGLCLWATPWNLEETFRLALGEAYENLLQGEKLLVADACGKLSLTPDFIRDFANYDLKRCIRLLSGTPILFVHGDSDDTVPIYQAETLFQCAGEPKEFVVIKGGNHQLSAHNKAAAAAVIAWLTRLSAVGGL